MNRTRKLPIGKMEKIRVEKTERVVKLPIEKVERITASLPVTRAALMARINRKLRQDGQVLRATRSAGARQVAGEFHVLGTNPRAIVRRHVDPVVFARELGVLQPWEKAEL